VTEVHTKLPQPGHKTASALAKAET
jgi:hypothetical protein